ncbi:hypothetical protein Y032_0030g2232 [Ancylostoma ceylanicum]|uniref:Serpentine Receptor, class H n=1 Tax=Ancylostoma ceylanicum TaxID=53326 RepID=A0A016USB5_9BILA|nr:hypothetical protein Y032_0030g2232 [Ancylostoma ceylanicum]
MDIFRDSDDNPSAYIALMRYSCVYTVPIYLLSMYCVLFVTASKSAFKWNIAYHCTVAFLFEIILNVGATPVLYIQIIGGHPVGLMTMIGIPPIWQLVVVIVLLSETGLSLVQLFHYQYRYIVPSSYFLRIRPLFTKILFIYLYLLGLVLNFVLVLLSIPEQTLLKKKIREYYFPVPQSLISNGSLIVVDPTVRRFPFYLVPPLVNVVIGAFACVYFAFSIIHYLYASKLFRSQQLLKLQKAVITELCVKASVSAAVFVIPGCIILGSFLLKQSSQDIINHCLYCIGSIGSAGNLGMLMSSPRYRKRLKHFILGMCL